jgi:hypothetical protein
LLVGTAVPLFDPAEHGSRDMPGGAPLRINDNGKGYKMAAVVTAATNYEL